MSAFAYSSVYQQPVTSNRQLVLSHCRCRHPPHRRPQVAVRPELARRHSIALAELLVEVVLGVEHTAAGDLRDAQVTSIEQAGRLLQALLFQEVAQETAGDAVEAARDVLPRVAELFRDRLDRDLLVGAQPAAHGFDQGTK